MGKIILFGGTFDPIHHGHFLMAEYAYQVIKADQVIFIPAKTPRWKNPVASKEDRYAMLKRYLKPHDWAKISLYELETKGEEVNYSIDTIDHFQKTFPDDAFFWLLGADQVAAFPRWKDAEKIATKVQLLVYSRPDIPLDEKIIADYRMRILNGPSSKASSSAVRKGQALDTELDVLNYIEKQQLYYVKHLQKFLDKKRLAHSFTVARLAYLIAQANDLDKERAYLAGLLHDLGKNMPLREQKAIMQAHYPAYQGLKPENYHQFIGEYLAKEEFLITDEEVLLAIRTHNTGAANLRPLQMIVYAADKIEPTRGFDSSDLIEVCLEDYYRGFIATLAANREFLALKQVDTNNPLTQACFQQYLKE
ncbi:MAG: nicotinate (nicotinamide) nucleotide adenylyltransferase [Bacilli bacterium]